MLLSCDTALAATDDPTPNPYRSGVFARAQPSAEELAAYARSLETYARKPRRAASVGELLTDKEGRSNELILLADDNNAALRALVPALAASRPGEIHAEDAIVLGIENGDKSLIANFANPIDARYVVDDDRTDEATRQLFKYDDPYVRLLRYAVLRYASIDEALKAFDALSGQLGKGVVGVNSVGRFAARQSDEPNDPYYAFDLLNPNYNYQGHTTPTKDAQYQWGLQAMKFPQAWRTARGHGYIGALDSGLEEIPDPTRWDASKFKWPLAKHADLRVNYRPQFSSHDTLSDPSDAGHGTHVSGILAATTNNGTGVAGACPDCSFAMIRRDETVGNSGAGVRKFAERGIQAFNMSFETDSNLDAPFERWNCPVVPGTNVDDLPTVQAYCDALALAANNDLLPIAAAGNFAQTGPAFPARVGSVLAVAGAQITTSNPQGWQPWAYTSIPHSYDVTRPDGTSYGGINAVAAPAKSIVSTFPLAAEWDSYAWAMCSDIYSSDESGPPRTPSEASDGYGSCTGTSMAAPHVTALAGILRSVNPLLNASQIKGIIRASSDHYHVDPSQNDPVIGSGMPDANLAVTKTLETNPDRLTPLFAFYSANRRDRFYTTVPQMATAAAMGTLEPRGSAAASALRYSAQGTAISTYWGFPGLSQFSPTIQPKAEAWIFTTPQNPVNPADTLVPLYRLSWKCGDDTPVPPTAVCNVSNQQHVDVAYTTSATAVDALKSLGYTLDGIEGYVFPKTSAQPPGTVKLLSGYNPSLDDNAIYPETVAASMTGYTDTSEPDGWLGYVYANSGTKPVPVAQPHYVKRTLAFAPQWTYATRVVCNAALNSYCRLTEVEVRDDRNWAAAASGATVGASSTYNANYPAAAAIDGDRLGASWGNGGGWNDADAGVFPDWLQVNLNGTHVLSSVTVYTLQDNFPNPAEPTDDTTFTAYGLTAFDVQAWNGSAWITVASVSGNDRVKRRVTFAPVATSAIRIVCNAGLTTHSRIVEVEARDDRNWAAAASGASASASSSFSAAYPVAAIIDGDRKGLNWGNGGGWNDATMNVYPDWARIDFDTHHWFNQVSVYTLQDNFPSPVEPTDTMLFTQWGITSFDVQVWDGVNWTSMGTVSN